MLCVLVGRKLSEVTSNYISNNFKYVEIYTRINLTNDTSILVLSIYPSPNPLQSTRNHFHENEATKRVKFSRITRAPCPCTRNNRMKSGNPTTQANKFRLVEREDNKQGSNKLSVSTVANKIITGLLWFSILFLNDRTKKYWSQLISFPLIILPLND